MPLFTPRIELISARQHYIDDFLLFIVVFFFEAIYSKAHFVLRPMMPYDIFISQGRKVYFSASRAPPHAAGTMLMPYATIIIYIRRAGEADMRHAFRASAKSRHRGEMI